ncbi:MAG: transglutaminase TgpA family protein [Armatimonadota bacterium]
MVRWRRLLSSGPPEHSVPLRLWTLASVVVSLFAVTAHDDFLEYRLIVPVLVATGFGFSYWRRGRRNWWVKILLGLLCLWVGWQFLRDVVSDPYHTSIPLTVLLLWLQTLHSFDVPARRDLLFSLLSAVILMAVAGAFTTDLTYLAYLAAFALAGVQALVHNAWQGTQEAIAAPRTPGERADAAGASSSSIVLAANHLLAIVLLCAAAIFVLTPRFEGVLVSSLPFSPQRVLLDLFAGRIVNPAYPEAGPEGGGAQTLWNPRGYFGFSPHVDLRLRGRLDDALVMRVRANRQFNWRALVFDTYTGAGWRIADQAVSELDGGVPPIAIVHRRDEVLSYNERTIRVTQTFYVEAEQPNVIFAAPLVERLYLTTGKAYLDRYGSIRLPGTLKPGMVYSVISRALIPDARRLRAVSTEAPRFIKERYLRLPPLPDRVGALAKRIVAGHSTTYDRVVAINRHLWTAYRYDLTIPPQRRPGDAVDYFLFEERRGYCEQFASAMVVLLRSAAIPSRLVTGYGPGTLNAVTGLLEVRNSDAHAWVEVFFPGVGWVEFEPTPGFPDTADLGGPATRRWVFQDLAVRLSARLKWLEARSPLARQIITGAASVARPSLMLVVALAGLAAAVGTWRVAGHRASPATPRAALNQVYLEMCAVLARRGVRRGPADTIEEFRSRAEASRDLPEVGEISSLVEAAAYGGSEPDEETVRMARHHLDALRVRMRQGRGPAA